MRHNDVLITGGYSTILSYLAENFQEFNNLGWLNIDSARDIDVQANWFMTHLHPASVRLCKGLMMNSSRFKGLVAKPDSSERDRTIEELFNFILPRIEQAVNKDKSGWVLNQFSILDI